MLKPLLKVGRELRSNVHVYTAQHASSVALTDYAITASCQMSADSLRWGVEACASDVSILALLA